MSASAFREAREWLGVSVQELAAEVGLNEASYLDLEAYENEAYMCLSLGQLRAVADRLGMTPARLLGETESGEPITPAELASTLQAAIGQSDANVEEYETKVGWELRRFLKEPQTLLAWTPDGLRDLCNALNVEWVRALPSADRGRDV